MDSPQNTGNQAAIETLDAPSKLALNKVKMGLPAKMVLATISSVARGTDYLEMEISNNINIAPTDWTIWMKTDHIW